MKNNDLIKTEEGIFRILRMDDDKALIIDCEKKTMPQYVAGDFLKKGILLDEVPEDFPELDELSPADRKVAQQRYTIIAGVVTVVNDSKLRNLLIETSAKQYGVSKQTIRSYLCTYLVYQNIAALAPKQPKEKELSKDQKNMRWALNKFFYTRNQNSLSTAYTMMLKAKYCDDSGVLLSEYPTFNQFRYFYRKHRKMETFYISRGGIKDYQRNKRPLLGDGVQEFAPSIGTAMLDATICDIYLVNDKGQLVGRPILVAACDANTSLCLGYALLWEGGTYSLQNLMFNILEDKVDLCERMGIRITDEQWPVNQLPGIMITDGGAEYKGQTFEQMAELGVTLINLPSFRPELKGIIEKLFDLVQSSYRGALQGKGMLMPDYQERGSHDYRKDAVLTMQEFERIVVRCIVHYNCERVIQNYPYLAEMIADGVAPYANTIWNWKKNKVGANLINVSSKELLLTLLPRTTGKFTRYGLKVNRLRYYAEGYKEQFLRGGEVAVAYNPDNCSKVWIKENDGSFVEFVLIESRFADMSFDAVMDMQHEQKKLIKDTMYDNYQAKIELQNYIETVSAKVNPADDVQIKDIRAARKSATRQRHKDIGGMVDE